MKKAKEDDGFPSDRPEIAASSKLVLSLIRKSNETKTRMQSISGELGEEIKSAVENKHLHAGALKLVAKLASMDAIKRDAFQRAFKLYIDYAIEGGLFGGQHVGDLVEQAEADVETSAKASRLGDGAAGNVEKLRLGIKKTENGGTAHAG